MGLLLFPHQDFSNFFWKRVRYDLDGRRLVTYECGSCGELVEASDDLMNDELAKHEESCGDAAPDSA